VVLAAGPSAVMTLNLASGSGSPGLIVITVLPAGQLNGQAT
jgi:hypothetical protein